MDVKRGLDLAVAEAVKAMKAQAKPVKTNQEIEQVAFISANGDADVAKKLAEAMEKVGKLCAGRVGHLGFRSVKGRYLGRTDRDEMPRRHARPQQPLPPPPAAWSAFSSACSAAAKRLWRPLRRGRRRTSPAATATSATIVAVAVSAVTASSRKRNFFIA